MIKFLVIPLLLGGSLFAGQTCTAALVDPYCPTVNLFTINGVDYTNIFTVSAITPASEYSIAANAIVGGFHVNFNATTQPDPVIDFGMSFDDSTDPPIFLSITTPYFSETGFNEFGDSFLDQLIGSGSAVGTIIPPEGLLSQFPAYPYFEEFDVNQTPVDFENSSRTQNTFIGGPFPNTGNLTLNLGFNLTLNTGASFTASGSAGFVPEPGTLGMLGAGLLTLAAFVRRARFRAQK